MIRAWLGACLMAAASLLALPAQADERILGFDSLLAIQADGSVLVTENITVSVEGTAIRRGIFRDFPTRYTDRYGNRVRVGFEVLGVERDGRPEPWFTEKRPNGVRVNTGNDSFLAAPATYTFSIRYRTNRQIGFFADHDELYWNVTGSGWAFPINEAQATVTLPTLVPSDQLRLDAYTGPVGARGQEYRAASPQPGVAVFRTRSLLSPGEGLTIAVGFPKGIVRPPTASQKWQWFLRDNRGVLVALASLLLLAGFYFARWLQVGRDPPAGPIFPRYAPPAEFGPGESRALRRMGNDGLCFTADVVDMAVRGFLQIHQDGKNDWRLVREPQGQPEALTPSQRMLAARLFKEGDEIALKNTNATRVRGAMSAHAASLALRLKPAYYIGNGYSLLAGVLFSLVTGVLAFAISGGAGIPALVAIALVCVFLHFMFGFLLKAPTSQGRKQMDEIEGLRLYLGVAERDELKAMTGPGTPPALDAKRYEALLPYAMALDVEEAWTRQFTAAVGAAAATQSSPSWYYGSHGGQPVGLANLGRSLGGALTTQIASSSTPPGSSSGGGGGGFSGGGGGGGGGGGR
jgi:uncharacterized membrane protein YgcG